MTRDIIADYKKINQQFKKFSVKHIWLSLKTNHLKSEIQVMLAQEEWNKKISNYCKTANALLL